MPSKITAVPRPPDHLRAPTREWFTSVVSDYQLEQHHIRLLTLAAESWDRCVEAREALAEHGLVYTDRFGSPRARPEIAVERDNKTVFARLLRELDLDIDPPPTPSRAPALRSNRK